jgi:uncharacterized caspase-like protein
MTNSQTPHSRALRERTARAWEREKLAEGFKRVQILLPPDTAAMLDRLAVEHKTKTDAIIAAIRALAAKERAEC